MIDQVLYPSKNLVFRKADNFHIVLNPEAPNIMVVDDIGCEILQLCNGSYTRGNMIDIISSRHMMDEIKRDELANFISALTDAGFLSPTQSMSNENEFQGPKKLVQLYLHLTHECNLRCRHCYLQAGAPLQSEISEEKMLNTVKEFSELGGEHLILTGGEPLLKRNSLFKLLSLARDCGINKIDIETNGTLVTDEDAYFFNKHQVDIGISLDGATPETHNSIRGEGTFEHTIRGIRKLANANVHTIIAMTLMRSNLNEAEKMVYLVKELGASSFTLNLIKIIGRAQANSGLAISFEEMIATINKVWQIAKNEEVKTNIDDLFLDFKAFKKKISCGAGRSLLSLAADGNIYPCNMLQERSLNVGNIKNESLREIWERSNALPILNLSVLKIPECRECELKYLCCGGCPADSYHAYKDFNIKSPRCTLYKEVFWNMIERLSHELWQQT